jgi:all-trans-retinol 13,14-reductase
VVTFVPWKSFADWQGSAWKKRGEDYEALKVRLRDSLLEQFLERLPELRPMVDYAELSTPVSTDHFVRPVAGSIYGLEPTPERFRSRLLRPRSPIPGLYFAGSEVAMVGVMGAMLGGALAAVAAEPLRAIGFLRRV